MEIPAAKLAISRELSDAFNGGLAQAREKDDTAVPAPYLQAVPERCRWNV